MKKSYNYKKALFLFFIFFSSFLYSLQSPAKLIVLNNDEYKLYKEYKSAIKTKNKIDINSSISNIEKLLLDKNKESSSNITNKRSNFIVEKSNKIYDRNIDDLSNEELLDIRNQDILNRFNSTNEEYFTIPIASYSKTEYANEMILEYFELDENVTYFDVKIKNKNYIKVLYGIYKTKKEALDKLDFLYKKLSKILKPNDTNVYKIKKYKKYFN